MFGKVIREKIGGFLQNGYDINVLTVKDDAKIAFTNDILSKQLVGEGQIVEISRFADGESVNMVLCSHNGNDFIVLQMAENFKQIKVK